MKLLSLLILTSICVGCYAPSPPGGVYIEAPGFNCLYSGPYYRPPYLVPRNNRHSYYNHYYHQGYQHGFQHGHNHHR